MDSSSKSMHFSEMIHNLEHFNLSEKLNIMPKSEMATLKIILKSENKEIRVCEIAKKLNISAPAVSRTLRKLEEKGCIERITNKTDRRNTNIKVTKKGKDTFYTDMHIMGNFLNCSLEHLSDDEAEQLIFLIRKLHESMRYELEKMNNE
ncbi:MAG: MarR family transcriptional regulator [Clostridia bacterium]|nr:MarR family transcriptional regulator [Clostridia bacterium]